jgi:glyoxylase-like metal-dependent hydrolase (beta-lactamase superfamily II)
MTLRVHHLNCGTLCPVCQRLINGHGSWLQPGRLVCHCLLIETPEALVLVDTGLGSRDIADPGGRLGLTGRLLRPLLEPAETALAQVRALGHDPRDVRHIITTHLDLDHAGGLADFPEAAVHVLEPELQAALHPGWREKARYRQVQFAHGTHWHTHPPQGEDWFGFQSIRAIPGLSVDVLMIPLLGHSRGHSGVAVKTGDTWLLHCGDAYFHRGTLTGADISAGIKLIERLDEVDAAQRHHNQTRLRDLATHHGDEVSIFCSHDPGEWELLAGDC